MALHVEHGVTAVVAVVSGIGSYMVQAIASPGLIPLISITITLVSAIVAGAVAWGVLKADHRTTRQDVERLSELAMEMVQRLSRIEAKLEK